MVFFNLAEQRTKCVLTTEEGGAHHDVKSVKLVEEIVENSARDGDQSFIERSTCRYPAL